MRPVGYYVHHLGMGHFDRARLIASALKRPCTLIGTMDGRNTDGLDVLPLPDDAVGIDAHPSREMPHALHFAPLDFAPVRERMARITAWVAERKPAVVVVDVSVEVALFCRLLSVPTIYLRLAGDRTDPAHLEAFRSAERIIAPFPQAFEHPATPDWVRDKTVYAGFIHAPMRDEILPAAKQHTIAVVLGSGGSHVSIGDLVTAARATPDHFWIVYGTLKDSGPLPPNLTLQGFVSDIDDRIASAEILIGAAGDGVLSLAVRHKKRFICIPEERPYEEQIAKARVLDAHGVVIVRPAWPEANEWPGILHQAARIDPNAISGFRNKRSLADVVTIIEDTAALFDP